MTASVDGAPIRVTEWARGLPRRAQLGLLWMLAAHAGGCASFWDETAPAPTAGATASPAALERPDDENPEALIPAGVQTVIDVNMAQFRQSPWVAPVLDARDPRHRSEKEAALGYDDVKDVDRLIYAVTLAGADVPTLVVAQGRLREDRVEEAFRNRWTRTVADRWRKISIVASGENAIAFLTPRTFLAGAPASVHDVIDRAFAVGLDVSADPALGPIRRALCPEGRDAKPALLVTIALDDRVRARVADVMPLPRELRQVGLRVDLGKTADMSLLGILDDHKSSVAFAHRLRALLDDPGTRLALATVGLGTLPAETRIVIDGARVAMHASVADESRPAVTAWLRTLVESRPEGISPGSLRSW